jgi:putative membrane-bound dehydrogenase-like protein
MRSPALPRFFQPLPCSLFAVILLLTTTWSHGQTQPAALAGPAGPTGPLAPHEALRHFHLAGELVVELVACEPQVSDPVAIRFDERGRMWVVEMHDYPHGPAEGEQPTSRIRCLEDQDGDGFFETAHTFADALLFPTGLQPWRGGWIVTMSGRVIYLKDTDGDGRADQQEMWFSGFAEENSQLRANHPKLALDTQIYVANGLRGGDVKAVRGGQGEPISIRNRDFRFDPLGEDFRAISGHGQFGLTFDDFGRRFVCSNRNPLQHVVIEDRYLQAHPNVALPAVVHDVAAFGEQSRLFPISRAWTTSTLHANQFTAACGVLIFRGQALGSNYQGNAFTCDPKGDLVHREIMRPHGGTFTSQPPHAKDGIEFLATTDEWFRPVNLEEGPDGALYIVDMYRAVIEHPQFMPDELKDRPDLRKGVEQGRIYRIRSPGPPLRVKLPDTLDQQQLVRWLQHDNAWHRETAARLLLESESPVAIDKLQAMAAQGDNPPGRAQALWLLARWNQLPDDLLARALADVDPGVREQALVLAETRLGDSPELRRMVLTKTSDVDGRVRFQAVLSLGAAQGAD